MQQLIKKQELDLLKISQQELIEKFKIQLIKDFEMSDVLDYLEPITAFDYESIHKHITKALKNIDAKGFSKYQHLLYRIDISEKQLDTELKTQPSGEHYSILADLIIKRILQKIILKIQHSKK